MTGFLEHLAGKALGLSPVSAARPFLPSRFAQARSHNGGDFTEVDGGESTLPSHNPSEPLAPAQATSRTGTHETVGQARQWSAPDLESDQHSAPAVGAVRELAAEMRPARHTEVPVRNVPPRAADAVDAPPSPAAGPERFAEPDPAPRPERPLTAAAAVPPAVRAPLALVGQPAARVQGASTPLTEAAVAGRSQTTPAKAPVVHVTIDRIDVRAPAAARPGAAERRPRPQPSVSLSDYLGGGGAGGRP